MARPFWTFSVEFLWEVQLGLTSYCSCHCVWKIILKKPDVQWSTTILLLWPQLFFLLFKFRSSGIISIIGNKFCAVWEHYGSSACALRHLGQFLKYRCYERNRQTKLVSADQVNKSSHSWVCSRMLNLEQRQLRNFTLKLGPWIFNLSLESSAGCDRGCFKVKPKRPTPHAAWSVSIINNVILFLQEQWKQDFLELQEPSP